MHVLIGGKSMVYYNLKHEFMAINTINHRCLTNQKFKKHLRYFLNILLLSIFFSSGHYCPLETQSPTQFPCVAGSWTNLTNLKSQEECYECPKGWFCLTASTAPTDLCFTGHYCPPGVCVFMLLLFFFAWEGMCCVHVMMIAFNVFVQ